MLSFKIYLISFNNVGPHDTLMRTFHIKKIMKPTQKMYSKPYSVVCHNIKDRKHSQMY